MTKAVATITRCNVLTEQSSFNRTTGDDIYTLVARMRWTRKRLVVVIAGHDKDLTAEDAEVRRGHPTTTVDAGALRSSASSAIDRSSSALDTTKI